MMTEFLVLLAMLGVPAGLWFLLSNVGSASNEARQERLRWQAVADETALNLDWKTLGLEGERSGLQVGVQKRTVGVGKKAVSGMEVRVTPLAPKPLLDWLEITHAHFPRLRNLVDSPNHRIGIDRLDETFNVSTTAPNLVRGIFANPLAHALLDHASFRETKGGTVIFWWEGDDLSAIAEQLDRACRRVNDLLQAIEALATQLAERTGLFPERDPDRVLPRYRGVVDGVDIVMREGRRGGGLRILATIPEPADASVVVVSKEADAADGVAMLDPILDATVTVTTEDPAAARTLLVADSVRENLLVVLKTYEGAKVDGAYVFVPVLDLTPDVVAQAVGDAVALARSLSAPQRPVSASATWQRQGVPKQRQ